MNSPGSNSGPWRWGDSLVASGHGKVRRIGLAGTGGGGERVFSRIAIVNRGEPAMRLIHAVRDLNAETGSAIQTIALYTDADRTAMFVREADVAYPLGPASAHCRTSISPSWREALRDTGADAAWVGWGFVAEDPNFAELCSRLGVTFIGPRADRDAPARRQDRRQAAAEEAGVPVAAWSGGPVDTIDAAVTAAKEIGYPLMLKAAAGGGGRGIRKVAATTNSSTPTSAPVTRPARAFGSGTVFLERLVSGARHVEVQVIADATARRGRSASATAAFSAATRRSSRSRPRRCSRPTSRPS